MLCESKCSWKLKEFLQNHLSPISENCRIATVAISTCKCIFAKNMTIPNIYCMWVALSVVCFSATYKCLELTGMF
jgi:hypothetical protein